MRVRYRSAREELVWLLGDLKWRLFNIKITSTRRAKTDGHHHDRWVSFFNQNFIEPR